jgi:hypothetical protein
MLKNAYNLKPFLPTGGPAGMGTAGNMVAQAGNTYSRMQPERPEPKKTPMGALKHGLGGAMVQSSMVEAGALPAVFGGGSAAAPAGTAALNAATGGAGTAAMAAAEAGAAGGGGFLAAAAPWALPVAFGLSYLLS